MAPPLSKSEKKVAENVKDVNLNTNKIGDTEAKNIEITSKVDNEIKSDVTFKTIDGNELETLKKNIKTSEANKFDIKIKEISHIDDKNILVKNENGELFVLRKEGEDGKYTPKKLDDVLDEEKNLLNTKGEKGAISKFLDKIKTKKVKDIFKYGAGTTIAFFVWDLIYNNAEYLKALLGNVDLSPIVNKINNMMGGNTDILAGLNGPVVFVDEKGNITQLPVSVSQFKAEIELPKVITHENLEKIKFKYGSDLGIFYNNTEKVEIKIHYDKKLDPNQSVEYNRFIVEKGIQDVIGGYDRDIVEKSYLYLKEKNLNRGITPEEFKDTLNDFKRTKEIHDKLMDNKLNPSDVGVDPKTGFLYIKGEDNQKNNLLGVYINKGKVDINKEYYLLDDYKNKPIKLDGHIISSYPPIDIKNKLSNDLGGVKVEILSSNVMSSDTFKKLDIENYKYDSDKIEDLTKIHSKYKDIVNDMKGYNLSNLKSFNDYIDMLNSIKKEDYSLINDIKNLKEIDNTKFFINSQEAKNSILYTGNDLSKIYKERLDSIIEKIDLPEDFKNKYLSDKATDKAIISDTPFEERGYAPKIVKELDKNDVENRILLNKLILIDKVFGESFNILEKTKNIRNVDDTILAKVISGKSDNEIQPPIVDIIKRVKESDKYIRDNVIPEIKKDLIYSSHANNSTSDMRVDLNNNKSNELTYVDDKGRVFNYREVKYLLPNWLSAVLKDRVDHIPSFIDENKIKDIIGYKDTDNFIKNKIDNLIQDNRRDIFNIISPETSDKDLLKRESKILSDMSKELGKSELERIKNHIGFKTEEEFKEVSKCEPFRNVLKEQIESSKKYIYDTLINKLDIESLKNNDFDDYIKNLSEKWLKDNLSDSEFRKIEEDKYKSKFFELNPDIVPIFKKLEYMKKIYFLDKDSEAEFLDNINIYLSNIAHNSAIDILERDIIPSINKTPLDNYSYFEKRLDEGLRAKTDVEKDRIFKDVINETLPDKQRFTQTDYNRLTNPKDNDTIDLFYNLFIAHKKIDSSNFDNLIKELKKNKDNSEMVNALGKLKVIVLSNSNLNNENRIYKHNINQKEVNNLSPQDVINILMEDPSSISNKHLIELIKYSKEHSNNITIKNLFTGTTISPYEEENEVSENKIKVSDVVEDIENRDKEKEKERTLQDNKALEDTLSKSPKLNNTKDSFRDL